MASIACRGDGVGQSSRQRPALRRWRRVLVMSALFPVAVHCEARTLAKQLNDLIRAPITLVSATLGHADLKTTSVCAHARPDESRGRYLKTKF